MIKIIYIPNRVSDSTFSRELIKREIERKEGFKVTDVNTDVGEALRASAGDCPDVLIIDPAEQDAAAREQIETIVSFRRAHPRSGPSDVLITSGRILEYAARRLGDADLMYQFLRPSEPYEIADKLERMYGQGCCRTGRKSERLLFVRRLKELLLSMEIYPSYKGFNYLVDAVVLERYSTDRMTLTKEIYPWLGEKYGRSPGSVERAIRLLTFIVRDNEIWRARFPFFRKRPSNSELIAMLAELPADGEDLRQPG